VGGTRAAAAWAAAARAGGALAAAAWAAAAWAASAWAAAAEMRAIFAPRRSFATALFISSASAGAARTVVN
jgi:hypothetical protein